MSYNIYTYGNGETLVGIFNAISMCINSNSGSLYQPLILLGTIVGFLWATIYTLYNDLSKIATSWLLPLLIITGVLFVPTARVNIIDNISKYHDSVANVPYGLAMFASYVSRIGYGITEQVEKHFSMPDDLKFQKTGYIFASNLMQKSNQFTITNADLAENMHSFVNECIVYDAMLGRKYTLNDLKNSNDIWGLVSSNASPIRHFMWRDPRDEGSRGGMARPCTCKEGITKFNSQWGKTIDTTSTVLGYKIFGKSPHINPKTELLKYLPLTYGQLGLMSQDATNIIKQQIMISSFIKDTDKRSVSLGNASNFAAQRAYLSQRTTYQTLGAFAGDNLPTLKAVMESITYASFIFMMFLAILPFGWRILSSWAQIVLWLQLWAPLYAILNYIMLSKATSKTLAAMSISNSAGVTIANSVGILDANADISATSGFLALSIPFISYALVKGGVGSFVSLASHLGHVGQTSASQAAGEATSGNYGFGNISGEGSQIGNSSMFQQSMAASYRSGSFSLADGRTEVSTMADGSQLMSVGSSNLPVSLNVAESQSAQYSAMANKSYQNAQNLTESSAASIASSYRDLVDLSKNIGNSHQASDALNKGISVDDSKAINNVANIIKEFSDNHNISEDKAASIFAEASVGGKAFGVGASVGGRVDLSARDQQLLTDAQRVVQSEDFQEAHRLAMQATQNTSHNLSDESSKRLAESATGSYERGMQQRAEASKNYSQAESYSQQAMFTKANSASINSNYNQKFVEWLSDQRADGTSGRIGNHGASHIIANDPEMTASYANRFMSERGVIPSSSVGSNAQTMKDSYDHENSHQQHAVTRDSLNAIKSQGQSEITSRRLDQHKDLEGEIAHQISRQESYISRTTDDLQVQQQVVIDKINFKNGNDVELDDVEKAGREFPPAHEDIYN